jgi:hypothetical protein
LDRATDSRSAGGAWQDMRLGLRPTRSAITEWPKLVENWLKTIEVPE